MTAIPVICDRCRAEGHAGEDPFAAIADLLEFEPVKRRAHVNNWTAEHQRAFIAALATTGSPRQAAAALGRHAFGAEQLRKVAGGRGFAAAWDAALELYRERERVRIRDNLAALVEQQQQRDEPMLAASHLRALPPPSRQLGEGAFEPSPARGRGQGEGESGGPAQPWNPDHDLTLRILERYGRKLIAEHRARHEGRIAEADFYLRQATFLEICMEVPGLVHVLTDARIGGIDLVAIADTPLSRILADIRHAVWRAADEPERPHAPEHLMIDHGPCRTEIAEVTGTGTPAPSWVDAEEWRGLDYKQQLARLREQYARDVEAYKAWIERATAEWQRRNSFPA
jgi:hypothetical protein